MKNIEVCAAIILNDKNEILAVERGYGEFKDWWEFPGGKIEKNETKEECIKREIQEEMSADIDPFHFLGTIEHDYPTFHLTMHCFLARFLSKNFNLNEHEDKKFVNINEVDKVDFLPADVKVLPLIREYFSTQQE